jgi:hypothetical protein
MGATLHRVLAKFMPTMFTLSEEIQIKSATERSACSRAHPVSYPMVPGALSLGTNRPGHEAHHSPLSSADVSILYHGGVLN